uniref:Uncharacterized protein n=1 Tax=Micrurus spixii TaxID=129469 RepID=A0A2D4LHI8_9SAUR
MFTNFCPSAEIKKKIKGCFVCISFLLKRVKTSVHFPPVNKRVETMPFSRYTVSPLYLRHVWILKSTLLNGRFKRKHSPCTNDAIERYLKNCIIDQHKIKRIRKINK